jgi:hypothetical protein
VTYKDDAASCSRHAHCYYPRQCPYSALYEGPQSFDRPAPFVGPDAKIPVHYPPVYLTEHYVDARRELLDDQLHPDVLADMLADGYVPSSEAPLSFWQRARAGWVRFRVGLAERIGGDALHDGCYDD